MTPKYIIIHHSASPDRYLPDITAIREYHMSKRWRDVGYHFLIDKMNKRYEVTMGRMLTERGAHCRAGSMNSKSLGVCLVGNFDQYAPSIAQTDLAIRLVASLAEVFDIPVENILGHGEVDKPKTCPGGLLDMPNFRAEIYGVLES